MATTAVAVAITLLITVSGTQVVAQVSEPPVIESGFTLPFAGTPELVYLAPTQATTQEEINLAIGQEVADFIAEQIGLDKDKDKVLTEPQFILFITGRGRGGDPELAKLADESVRIFIDRWFRRNGARESLEQLKSSAYRMEAFWGAISQQISGAAQLVPNHKESGKTYVGMSMVPSIWLTNFALLYTLNPKEAAKMPAFWTPIPENVADAILKSPQGRVRYSKYESEFKND